MLGSLVGMVLPGWAKYAAIAMAAFSLWLMGDLHGHTVAGKIHNDYIMAQAAKTVAIGALQTKVVVQTETVYRDRIQKIYLKGEQIENSIPSLVLPSDDDRYHVNAGFVRVLAAAWTGDAAGPAAESDRESSGVSISSIAEVEAHNATSCRAWREQALGWRQFYSGQQEAINGIKPAWYIPIQGASVQDKALPPAPMAPVVGEVK
jgi:hypothetical protein